MTGRFQPQFESRSERMIASVTKPRPWLVLDLHRASNRHQDRFHAHSRPCLDVVLRRLVHSVGFFSKPFHMPTKDKRRFSLSGSKMQRMLNLRE
jgi:hypothetical protein